MALLHGQHDELAYTGVAVEDSLAQKLGGGVFGPPCGNVDMARQFISTAHGVVACLFDRANVTALHQQCVFGCTRTAVGRTDT